MSQDFDRKISICIRKDLPEWQQLNATAHIAAHFGAQLADGLVTAVQFTSKDGFNIPRNSQYGIAILRAEAKDLRRVLRRAQEAKVDWMTYIREMVDLLDDNEVQKIVGSKLADELEYLGIGLFGDREVLQQVTKGLQAWR